MTRRIIVFSSRNFELPPEFWKVKRANRHINQSFFLVMQLLQVYMQHRVRSMRKQTGRLARRDVIEWRRRLLGLSQKVNLWEAMAREITWESCQTFLPVSKSFDFVQNGWSIGCMQTSCRTCQPSSANLQTDPELVTFAQSDGTNGSRAFRFPDERFASREINCRAI